MQYQLNFINLETIFENLYKYDVYINSDNGVNKPQNSLSSKVMGDKNCFIVR